MCLACEIDALWFAEIERAAPPPSMVDSSSLPAGERSPPPFPPPLAGQGRVGAGEGRSDDGRAESPSPGALRATDLSPAGRGEVSQRGVAKSAFLCEETRSQ